MGWKDKAVAGFFVLGVLAAAGIIGWVVTQTETRASARGGSEQRGTLDERQVRGLALDYGRAVQREDPDAACVLLSGDAYESFDCRFGRTDIPAQLAIPEGRQLAVRDVVVQGEQALLTLQGGVRPQPVRLQRIGRRWKIIRVGLPRPA
jgi:hypothetical protein